MHHSPRTGRYWAQKTRQFGMLPHEQRLRRMAARGRQPGRNLGLSAYDVELIKAFVTERPRAPLVKIAEFLEFETGRRVSVAVIHRVLRDRLRFSYKIGHRVALERCQIEADIYHEII